MRLLPERMRGNVDATGRQRIGETPLDPGRADRARRGLGPRDPIGGVHGRPGACEATAEPVARLGPAEHRHLTLDALDREEEVPPSAIAISAGAPLHLDRRRGRARVGDLGRGRIGVARIHVGDEQRRLLGEGARSLHGRGRVACECMRRRQRAAALHRYHCVAGKRRRGATAQRRIRRHRTSDESAAARGREAVRAVVLLIGPAQHQTAGHRERAVRLRGDQLPEREDAIPVRDVGHVAHERAPAIVAVQQRADPARVGVDRARSVVRVRAAGVLGDRRAVLADEEAHPAREQAAVVGRREMHPLAEHERSAGRLGIGVESAAARSAQHPTRRARRTDQARLPGGRADLLADEIPEVALAGCGRPAIREDRLRAEVAQRRRVTEVDVAAGRAQLGRCDRRHRSATARAAGPARRGSGSTAGSSADPPAGTRSRPARKV